MNKHLLALAGAAAAITAIGATPAAAQSWGYDSRYDSRYYDSRYDRRYDRHYDRRYDRRDDRRYEQPRRVWQGRDGRVYCERSDGTTGLIIGAAGGALLGREIDGGRNRTTGTVLGAALGGLIGRAIERGEARCR